MDIPIRSADVCFEGVKLELVIGRTTLMEHRDNTGVAGTDEGASHL